MQKERRRGHKESNANDVVSEQTKSDSIGVGRGNLYECIGRRFEREKCYNEIVHRTINELAHRTLCAQYSQ